MTAEKIHQKRARTKIVATVGPASREEDKLAELITAGVDVFRLNMAHGDLATHEQVLGRIRHLSEKLGRPVAVLADLAGPRSAVARFPAGK